MFHMVCQASALNRSALPMEWGVALCFLAGGPVLPGLVLLHFNGRDDRGRLEDYLVRTD